MDNYGSQSDHKARRHIAWTIMCDWTGFGQQKESMK